MRRTLALLCFLGSVPAMAQPQYDADLALRAEARVFRDLVVTTFDDDGAGSLRQVMREANDLCNDDICRIVFALPATAPENGIYAIRPQSPLPEITANNLIIDGGRGVEIRGDLLAEGDGIRLSTLCDASVLGLSINHFPGNGIALMHGASSLNDCPTGAIRQIKGSTLDRNGQGILIERDAVQSSFGWPTSIAENVITNSRSNGIFVSVGSEMDIRNNQIRGNGESGIVFGSVDHSSIVGNVIAGNGQMGIALEPEARAEIFSNAIVDNGLLGIDVGLDGVTPNADDDFDRAPNAPVLTSAYVDPSGRTIVVGRADSAPIRVQGLYAFPEWQVQLYASDSLNAQGLAQGGRLVAAGVRIAQGHAGFVAVIKENLAGKVITATLTRYAFNGAAKTALPASSGYIAETSEFSNPLVVQPWPGRRRSTR